MKYWFSLFLLIMVSQAHSQNFLTEIDSLRSKQLQDLTRTANSLKILYVKVLDQGTLLEKCQCLELHGNTLARLNEFKESISILNQAIQSCNEDTTTLAKVYNALGFNHDRLDDHITALSYFLQTAEAYDQLQDLTGLIKAYMNIASIFGQQESFEKVRSYLEKARELIPRINDPNMISQFYANAAAQYTEMGEHQPQFRETAIQFAETGVEHAKIHGLRSQLPDLYIVLSTVYWLEGNTDRALAFNDLYYLNKAHASTRANIIGTLRYGDIYTAQGQFLKAHSWYDSAGLLISQVGSIFYQATLEESKYKLYKAWGRTTEALVALEMQKSLEDSIFFLEQDNKIAELEAKFESERKAKEILGLQESIATQELASLKKNQIIFVVIVITLMLLSISWFYYQRRLSQQREGLAIQEQQLLRSQMNPHFLFNSLASIQDLVLQRKSREAVKYLAKFGTLIRNILDSSREEYIPLQLEIDMLQHYVSLENMRFEKQISLEINLDDKINPGLLKIPPMFVQPFIENAIKHGFEKLEGGTISLSFESAKKSLLVTVQDNGAGLTKTPNTEEKKVHAIDITQKRLENLYGKSNNTHLIKISDHIDVAGTMVTFQVPFKTSSI